MEKKWWPYLIVGGVVYLILRNQPSSQAAPYPSGVWWGGPGGATGVPGQTPNGDPIIPGWNAPPDAGLGSVPTDPGAYGGAGPDVGQLGGTTGPVTLTP